MIFLSRTRRITVWHFVKKKNSTSVFVCVCGGGGGLNSIYKPN
jgi:hypothetical protein